eukprot:CAMPEP_0183356958 /NCGR_PEP_ID=MMETSP0164_2-20130417/45294_1 /TAXON_ID=221442 /ORGANISM="Coccolithus pelagicus ssp braarudi, Strain PLY182g" /LENGTH=64 /DNA_ID=CAMNT_0025530483 /DNA_START=656 /DNA_END=850 /DNA_ORIENTATION=+
MPHGIRGELHAWSHVEEADCSQQALAALLKKVCLLSYRRHPPVGQQLIHLCEDEPLMMQEELVV